MAEVKMDLAELKQLEKEIEDLKNENNELKSNQKRVYLHHKYYKGKLEIVNPNEPFRIIYSCIPPGYTESSMFQYRSIQEVPINKLQAAGKVKINLEEDTSKTDCEFINLSDVEFMIQEKVQNEYKDRIHSLACELASKDLQLDDVGKQLRTFKDTLQLELDKKELEYNKNKAKEEQRYEQLLNEHHESYRSLRLQFDRYREDKNIDKLTSNLNELKNQLDKLKSRSLFKRIFNID